ncbi:MAG: arsenate reductase ArsC [Promethearchaeota archaeon]
MKKIKVLFICTGNSARSQIAEGLINNFYNDKFEAFSAGTKPSGMNPYTIKVMEEIDIDISKQRSKSITEFNGVKFDIVITVCDNTKKVCPFFSGAKKMINAPFDDPAAFKGADDQIADFFRSVRDQIKKWISENLIKS